MERQRAEGPHRNVGSGSFKALPKGGLMSGPIGQRLAERNIAEPPLWGVNYVPFSQGRTLQ